LDYGSVAYPCGGGLGSLLALDLWNALTGEAGEGAIRARFFDLVTEENLREKVAAETAGVRNVIVALAFGAVAR
jgi:hypothetical protein